MIAQEYLALPEADRRRVDPMITGFNPADMYGSDHIERALLTFPGVFAGIGEFSIHKEFVSSKVSGHAASLRNPALDRILATAAEIGLVVIFHNDIDHVRPSEPPHHAAEVLDLFARHAGDDDHLGPHRPGPLRGPFGRARRLARPDALRPSLRPRRPRHLVG